MLPLVWLIAKIDAFQFGVWHNRGMPIVNPVLIAMNLIMSALLAFDFDQFHRTAHGRQHDV